LQSTKQQIVLQLFNKDKCQLSERDNSQSGLEASTSTSNLQQTVKRICADMLTVAGGSKRRKGVFVKQYVRKHVQLGFTIAPCREKPPRSLYWVGSQILLNVAMKPSKLARHFHSKYSNLQGKLLDYIQRLFSEMNSQGKQIKNDDNY